MTHPRIWLPLAILLFYLVAGALYAGLTPAWQAPDEPAHYNYVRYLATEPGFPVLVAGCYNQALLNELTTRQFRGGVPLDHLCYEFHQPPLYYLLAAPLYRLTEGSLLILRLLSVLVGAGVIWLAFLTARTIFPGRPAITLGTMAFVAFVPMHVAMLASVNNDALAELLLAAILLLLVRRLVQPTSSTWRQDLGLGLLLGAGLITKTTVYIALPLVAVGLWLAHRRANWSTLLRHAGLIYGLALLLALPWFVRNVSLYGGVDVLALGQHDRVVVGQLRTADLVAEEGLLTYLGNFSTTTFRSFWGQFGWMAVPMDGRTYFLLAVLSLVALGGLLAFFLTDWTRLSSSQQAALALLGLMVLLVALAYSWYNLSFVQFQGRYLFPALVPLGLFFSVGMAQALRRRWLWWLAGGLLLALLWLLLAGFLGGGIDKWAGLFLLLALGLVVGRLAWPPRWPSLSRALLAAAYLGLAFLTLASPFWFVGPYL